MLCSKVRLESNCRSHDRIHASDEEHLVEHVAESPKGPQEMEVPQQRHEMPAFRSSMAKKGREVYEMSGN